MPLSNFNIDHWIAYLKIDNYLGTFPRDKIFGLKGMKGVAVCNMHESQDPGSHWSAFYLNGKRDAYFDSYGIQPIEEFIRIATKPYVYNSSQYQRNDTVSCGLFAIWWVCNVQSGYYKTISKLRIDDLDHNENYIRDWFLNKIV